MDKVTSNSTLNTQQQASSRQGLRGIDRGKLKWLSIQMTRQTPHHHPAEDHFKWRYCCNGSDIFDIYELYNKERIE
ncbi:hypothetical protein QQF64_021020 [Cirrhinus molitorella]|uniref:Uncharacterized protein n=1 Tax=Cirrhinus molitorella TaxID=172907 RepID=A0ABR3LCA9_9TELE